MALDMIDPDTECACGQTFAWHQANQPRHPFSPKGVAAILGDRRDRGDRNGVKTAQRGAERAATTVPHAAWPFDPVLRQALIDKGVLTPDDLRDAEAKIHEMSVVFNQGGSPWSAPREENPASSTETGKTSTER